MEKQILQKLKFLREQRTLKPIVLAEYLHIDESAYNKMENGTNNTWGKYLSSLLEFYQTSPKEFFSTIDGNNPTTAAESVTVEPWKTPAAEEKKHYADKTMVKSLLNSKDEIIMKLKEDKAALMEKNHYWKREFERVQRELERVKGADR